MEKIFILFSFYFFIIFSIIGYGNISSLIFKRTYSIGEQGLNGILLLILISYLTNFFSPHSIIHNLIIIIIGNLMDISYEFPNSVDREFHQGNKRYQWSFSF